MDLTKLEKLVGVSFEEYTSYHFFYESDGLQIEAYISAPRKEIKSDSHACDNNNKVRGRGKGKRLLW